MLFLNLIKLILTFGSLLFVSSILASESLSYSGRLVNNNGSPVKDTVNLTFDLAYSDQPASILCSQAINNVELANGVFHVKLAFPGCNLQNIISNVPTGHTIMIRVTDLTPDPDKVYSYQAIHSVPSSLVSDISKQLVQMNATPGQLLSWNGTEWAPFTYNPPSGATPEGAAGGALTGTYPSPGLAPIAQSNVINLISDLANKIGLTSLSASGPLVYDNTTGAFSIPEASVLTAGSMSSGDKIKLNDLEILPSSDGILERFSGVLRSNSCSSDQVLKWNAVGGWICGFDASTDSSKLPLTGGTLTGDLFLNTQLLIKNGGAANYVGLRASPTGTTAYTLTLPPALGLTDQVLATDSSGVLSWRTPAATTPPSGGAGGALTGTYPNPGLAPIAQSSVTNLVTDLASKIGLTQLSASSPLIYNNTTGAFTISAATTTGAGSMSAADKTKLETLEAFPGGDGLIERFSGVLRNNICSTDQVLKWNITTGWTCSVDNDSKWTASGANIHFSTGSVSVGTAASNAKLEVNGGIKIADDASTCNSTKQGTMRFVNGTFQGCDGTSWVTMGAVTPPGQIATYAMTNCPSGWLKANGTAVSRTTYSNLYSAIGTTWGIGDGSTTFNLPDLRGEFVRGFDDGRGLDAGRTFASAQADDNKSHSHTGTAASSGDHAHTAGSYPAGVHSHSVNAFYGNSSSVNIVNDSGTDALLGTDNAAAGTGFYSTARGTELGGDHSHAIVVNAAGAHTHSVTTVASGGTETRPKNKVLLYCIKI